MTGRPIIATWWRAARQICAATAFAAASAGLGAHPAAADFRLCNNTSSRVGVSIGYKDKDGWATEGWWNLSSRGGCEILLRGTLSSRYYYIYAVDYDRGGEWSGQAYMCTRDKEFTIRGIADCLARGYDRTGFFEVDTGEQADWTVQLTETSETKPGGPSVAPMQIPTPGRQGPTQPGFPAPSTNPAPR
ncbi:MAG TPA: DUF1036 domain-containing protein [Xanthobacteraceae bacterium]|jgi:uncharacterized membrane protein|nr:DUF1036 domain-containing protein [Xanthobacteraceae bacterium]